MWLSRPVLMIAGARCCGDVVDACCASLLSNTLSLLAVSSAVVLPLLSLSRASLAALLLVLSALVAAATAAVTEQFALSSMRTIALLRVVSASKKQRCTAPIA
jgi:hypothetical protein